MSVHESHIDSEGCGIGLHYRSLAVFQVHQERVKERLRGHSQPCPAQRLCSHVCHVMNTLGDGFEAVWAMVHSVERRHIGE